MVERLRWQERLEWGRERREVRRGMEERQEEADAAAKREGEAPRYGGDRGAREEEGRRVDAAAGYPVER